MAIIRPRLVNCEIRVADKRWNELFPEHREITDNILKIIPDISGEISVLLTNDSEIQELNRDFRGKDKPTNVLSFPNDDDGILGDIALSLDTLVAESESEGKTLKNHFTHLLLHGILHLQGHDHENDEEQHEMESFEIELLAKLGVPNPYE